VTRIAGIDELYTVALTGSIVLAIELRNRYVFGCSCRPARTRSPSQVT
jgi:hypothetical protein